MAFIRILILTSFLLWGCSSAEETRENDTYNHLIQDYQKNAE